jgi:hypothetical protein
VTFKDLKKRVTLETAQESKALEGLHNKPFWIWNIAEHKQADIKTNGSFRFNFSKYLRGISFVIVNKYRISIFFLLYTWPCIL